MNIDIVARLVERIERMEEAIQDLQDQLNRGQFTNYRGDPPGWVRDIQALVEEGKMSPEEAAKVLRLTPERVAELRRGER